MNRTEALLQSQAIQDDLTKIGLVKNGYYEHYTDEERDRYLSEYSSVSRFSEAKWYLDLVDSEMNIERGKRTFAFSMLNEQPLMQEVLKDWALDQLMVGRKVVGVKGSIHRLLRCLSLVKDPKAIHKIDRQDILTIHDYLFDGTRSHATACASWSCLRRFFEDLGYRTQSGYMSGYVIPAIRPHKVATKYIPDDVVKQLDVLFMKEICPKPYRGIYWVLRAFPNRLEEVVSMSIDCIHQIDDNRYLISIPVNKTSGNNGRAVTKKYEVIYEGMGKFLVDLLLEQQQMTKDIMPEARFLFSGYKYDFNKKSRRYSACEKPMIISESMCQNYFSKVGANHNIRDREGNIYVVSSHQFRHNGVTDRLRSLIFREIDVMYETGHLNTAMIERAYSHSAEKEREILFRGRVITADNKRMSMILQSPYAQPIYNLGVCADVRGCSSNRSSCLRCDFLEPDPSALPFFEHELEEWTKKKAQADKIGNTIFADLCADWIESYTIAIKSISNQGEQ